MISRTDIASLRRFASSKPKHTQEKSELILHIALAAVKVEP